MNWSVKTMVCIMSMLVLSVRSADQSGKLIISDNSNAYIFGKKYKDGQYNISSLLTGLIKVSDNSKFVIDGDQSFKFGIVNITVGDNSHIDIHAEQSQSHPMSNLLKSLEAYDNSHIILNNFGRSKTYAKLALVARDNGKIVVNEESSVFNPALDPQPEGTIVARDNGKLKINGWNNLYQEFIDKKIEARDGISRTIGTETSSKRLDIPSNRPTVVNQPIIINRAGNLEGPQRAEKVSWLGWLTSFMKPRMTVIAGQGSNNASLTYRLARLWYRWGTQLTGVEQDPVLREKRERELLGRSVIVDQEPLLPEFDEPVAQRQGRSSWWPWIKGWFGK